MSANENAALGSNGRQAPPTLKRSMGLTMATALVIGNMVGSGVFLLPASLADAAGPVSIAAWLFTGVAAMLLALVFARLGRTFPRTDGPYAYARISAAAPLTLWAFMDLESAGTVVRAIDKPQETFRWISHSWYSGSSSD